VRRVVSGAIPKIAQRQTPVPGLVALPRIEVEFCPHAPATVWWWYPQAFAWPQGYALIFDSGVFFRFGCFAGVPAFPTFGGSGGSRNHRQVREGAFAGSRANRAKGNAPALLHRSRFDFAADPAAGWRWQPGIVVE